MRYKKFDYTKLTPPCLALVRNLKFVDGENGLGKDPNYFNVLISQDKKFDNWDFR